jgi:predicted TIM-barrel fold metal-dependent hydrolase
VSLQELDRCKSELGLAGISFHTRFQGVGLNHPWVHRYVERMGEVGLVPVLHAIPESESEALWKVIELARKFPDLEMLVLDAFATFDGSREVFVAADVCPNLLFDTSLARSADLVEDFATHFGARRVVFGTDTYSAAGRRRLPHILAEIQAFDISEDDRRLILGDNARRLYGLT